MKRFVVISALALVLVPAVLHAGFLWFGKGSSKYEEAVFSVPGMVCDGCAAKIRENMLGLKGIVQTETFIDEKVAHVVYNKKKTNVSEVEGAIDQTGYDAQLVSVSAHTGKASPSTAEKAKKGCCALGSDAPKCSDKKWAEGKE